MPERYIKDYLSATSIHYDPGLTKNSINGNQLLHNPIYTPWVLQLKFDIQKVTSLDIWRKIIETLKRALGRQFDVQE